jgi:hypothetical protein
MPFRLVAARGNSHSGAAVGRGAAEPKVLSLAVPVLLPLLAAKCYCQPRHWLLLIRPIQEAFLAAWSKPLLLLNPAEVPV